MKACSLTLVTFKLKILKLLLLECLKLMKLVSFLFSLRTQEMLHRILMSFCSPLNKMEHAKSVE